ncbi:hypothetical protein [Frischella perrara]|nr:hypothetical protein [Frischella perrara]
MPKSIKPYIKNGSGVVGVIMPYKATSDNGGHFSARLFMEEVGVIP